MAVHTFSQGVDTLFSTTLSLIRKRLADAIFKQNPFTFYMLANGRVKLESGGFDIREPIIYQKNPTVMNYSGFDRLNVTPAEEVTSAIYQWKLKAATVSISGEDGVVKNSGPQALFSILQTKIKVAEMTLREDLNADLMRRSTLKGSKEFLGLDNFMEQGSYGTVGGINGTTYTWWRNKWNNSGSDAAIFADMRTMYHDCSKGGMRPDLILCPQDKFERYEQEIVTPDDQGASSDLKVSGMLRFTDTRLADVGFDNLKFKGATMMWDEMLEDSTLRPAAQDREIMYFIHSPSLSLTIHRNRNFVMKAFQSPYDQDAQVAQILLAGNLTASNRRNLGALYLT